jgi:hypothetical protein
MQKTFAIENLGESGIDLVADVLQDQIADLLNNTVPAWTRIKSVFVNFDKDEITVEFSVREEKSNVIYLPLPKQVESFRFFSSGAGR